MECLRNKHALKWHAFQYIKLIFSDIGRWLHLEFTIAFEINVELLNFFISKLTFYCWELHDQMIIIYEASPHTNTYVGTT